ncbi:MAG: hypothetical protein ACOX7K_09105 [Oscillospiraceae bacterium]|jgi:hypothetical protein
MKISPPKEDVKNAIIMLICGILQLLLITIIAIYESGFSGRVFFIFYLIIVILLAVAGYFFSILNRSYVLKQLGIEVHWIGKFSRYYRWEEFQTIRVVTIKMKTCDYRQCLILSKHLLPYPLVKTSYSWFERHPFSTLLFELTPERYVEFCEKFPNIKLEWEREDIG